MAAYNRYQGNSGRVIRVQEEPQHSARRFGGPLSSRQRRRLPRRGRSSTQRKSRHRRRLCLPEMHWVGACR